MARTEELKFIIDAEFKGQKAFKQAEKQLESTAKKMSSIGKNMSLAITLPFVLAAGLMTKSAIDAEEVKNKFNVVFKSVSADADAVAQDLRDNYGLARSSAEELLSATGDMLTGFGLTGSAALDLAEKTNKLAVDLASFTNIQGGAKRASIALTKALLGERESVKELGIAILEEDVKAKVKSLEATGRLTNETMRQKKAIATLEIAYEQSKNAIGDFARTQGSAANQLRVLKERLKEVSEVFGKEMIPIVTEMIKTVSSLIKWFSDMGETTKKVIFIFGTFLATLGPSIFIIGKVISAILALRTAMIVLRVATLAMLGPWAVAIAAATILASVVGFKLFSAVNSTTSAIKKLKDAEDLLNLSLADTTVETEKAATGFKEMGEEAKKAAEDLIKLRKKALDAIKGFNKDEAKSAADLAETSIEQSKLVARLTDELQDETMRSERDRDNIKINELKVTLEKEKDALRRMKFIRIEFAGEILEAERRASITAFERRVEDILKERVANLQRHLERLQQFVQEIKEAQAKNTAIAKSWANAQETMRKEVELTTKTIEIESLKQESIIQGVINKFSELTSAISTPAVAPSLRLQGGFQAGIDSVPRTGNFLLHKGERVIPAGGMMGRAITVNINGGVFLSEDVAEEIGDMIIDKLKRTIKI